MKISSILLLGALAVSIAKAIETYREPELPNEWERLHPAQDTTNMVVTLSLRQQNLRQLAQIAHDVSEPTHNRYGQHLSMKQVQDLTKPSEKTYIMLNKWFDESGARISKFEPLQGGAVLRLTMSVNDIRTLFKTTVTRIKRSGSKDTRLRAGDLKIPSYVSNEISAIFGLHGLPLPKRSTFVALRSKAAAVSPASVTPTLIGNTYNASNRRGTVGKASRQAVGEFQGQDALDSDTKAFFQQYVPNAKGGDEKLYKVVGSNDQDQGSIEGALDVEYIMGVAPGVLTEFWGYQQHEFCGDLQQFTQKILDTEDTPNVFSISYGWQGNLSEIGCQDNEVQAVDVNFQKLAARGISMIISSGDDGAGCKPRSGKLFPSWPASSPWVTAVGATRFIDQDPSNAEQATDQFGSGGGFSSDFDRSNATWQEDQVSAYLKLGDQLPPSWAFTANGRATPDVSALGEGFQVISNGRVVPVGGTSASTPLFAGLVSLINDVRVSKGKKPLGFLNPFIYSNPQAFTDITVGNNSKDETGYPSKYGFQCTKGWDPVTGLGTPKFDAMLEAAIK